MKRNLRVIQAALAVSAAGMLVIASGAMASAVESGDTVHIGSYNAHYFPVWISSDTSGPPDYWAYCLENQVTPRTNTEGIVGDLSDYLGENFFTESTVQGKVLWVLANSYPALSLDEFEAASGVVGITADDAIEATQYAIWRYTELTFDAAWMWDTPESEAAYWHLIAGANASGGLTAADLEVSVSLTAPAAAQKADSLIGPFTVNTNQATVAVSVSPAMDFVDAAGNLVDASAVVDGQELYLDARTTTAAGSATIIASARGLSGSGMIVSVPLTDGAVPTEEEHAQTTVLIAPSTATTTVQAAISWSASSNAAGGSGAALADTGPSELLGSLFAAGVVCLLLGAALSSLRRSVSRSV